MSSWNRRVSSAASRQALRDAAASDPDDEPVDDADDVDDDEDVDEAEGLTGEQIRTVLTDTLVETPDMVAVFASVGREALWANDAFVTIIPIRASDRLSLVELLDEWSRGHLEVKVLPALVKFGRWRGRLTFVSDGGPLPVSAVLVAHRDASGEIATVSLIARDLSELGAAQPDGGADETRFTALVENAADLIAVVAADGTIEYLSPAASRILGHEDGELEGQDLTGLIHPDDVPDELLDLARADEQGIGIPVELRLRGGDGQWRHLEVIASDLPRQPGDRGHRAQRAGRDRARRVGQGAGQPGLHRPADRAPEPRPPPGPDHRLPRPR